MPPETDSPEVRLEVNGYAPASLEELLENNARFKEAH